MKATITKTNLTNGETETRTIKLCDGFMLEYDGETERFESMADVFEAIHWNSDDDDTREAREVVIREMFCFGYVDFTPAMPEGHTLTVRAIPCND